MDYFTTKIVVYEYKPKDSALSTCPLMMQCYEIGDGRPEGRDQLPFVCNIVVCLPDVSANLHRLHEKSKLTTCHGGNTEYYFNFPQLSLGLHIP